MKDDPIAVFTVSLVVLGMMMGVVIAVASTFPSARDKQLAREKVEREACHRKGGQYRVIRGKHVYETLCIPPWPKDLDVEHVQGELDFSKPQPFRPWE